MSGATTHAPVRALVAAGSRRSAGRLAALSLYAASLAVALALAVALVTFSGYSAWDTVAALYDGSLNGGGSIGLTIDNATPLLLVAVGSIICSQAGIFNIGQEGQLAIGAMTAAAIALYFPGPGPLVLVVAIAGAAAGGACWAGIAGLLYYWRRVDVVICTLLLVFVAMQIVSFAVNRSYLLQETAVPGQLVLPESDLLPANERLPRLGQFPGFNVSTGVFLALVLTAVAAVALRHGRWGFRLRLLGLTRTAAHRAGVRAALLGTGAVVLSGAFCGLAGGVMLTGDSYRIQDGFTDDVGWEGLLVALTARNRPGLAVPVALFFGALRAGGGFLAATGVPRYLVSIVTALLVLAAVFPVAFQEARRSQRGRAVARAAVVRG
jgi:simple sugar transport system permease protein